MCRAVVDSTTSTTLVAPFFFSSKVKIVTQKYCIIKLVEVVYCNWLRVVHDLPVAKKLALVVHDSSRSFLSGLPEKPSMEEKNCGKASVPSYLVWFLEVDSLQ